MTLPVYPSIPAQVAPYVDALGLDVAVAFLLRFGGSEMTVPADPKGRSAVAVEFGIEAARALSAVADRLPRRVPLAKPWIAQVLHARGESQAAIARAVRASDVSVAKWVRAPALVDARPVTRQLPLF